jgi:hypothetical protein
MNHEPFEHIEVITRIISRTNVGQTFRNMKLTGFSVTTECEAASSRQLRELQNGDDQGTGEEF